MATRSSPSRLAFAGGVLDGLPGPRRLEGYVRTDTLIEWSLACGTDAGEPRPRGDDEETQDLVAPLAGGDDYRRHPLREPAAESGAEVLRASVPIGRGRS